MEEGAGDVLVFLTGQEEIESVERLVLEKLQQLPEEKRKLKVLPIYSSLPSEKQMQVFMPAPTGFRKVDFSFMFEFFSVVYDLDAFGYVCFRTCIIDINIWFLLHCDFG